MKAAIALALLALAACAPRPTPAPSPPHLTLVQARFADLPGWRDDATVAALPALLRSCDALAKLDPKTAVGPDAIAGTAADWRSPCAEAATTTRASDEDARRFFERAFVPWLVADKHDRNGLFTGYFEPELHGSRRPGGAYATPLLKRPPDLVAVDLGLFRPDWRGESTAGRVVNGRLVPYAARADIEHGALDRYRLAFLWVDDPIDAFVLSIQGSGRVRLADGTLVGVGYDGQNGRAYVAIGRLLVARGALKLEDASLAAIRAWLVAHPSEAGALMDENPSYVFFRELSGDGPIGAEGVILTPGRSLAVDPAFLPLGVPFWLDVAQDGAALRRLVVAQDTGGAIRGPVRGDLFFGFGRDAEAQAGRMRAHGAYYMLLPSGVAPTPSTVAAQGSAGRGG
ncbi:MAG TPA: murein transglycosylase A [Stellaceae bacterium]|nr:murein transglycosylase A [Stellaceae bacterium]